MQVFDGKVDASVNCRMLWEAMGVAQHHDAVSGTSKQHVANDYAKRLAAGADVAHQTMGRILSSWTGAKDVKFCTYLNISVCPATESTNEFTVIAYNPSWQERDVVIRVPLAKRTSVAVSDGKDDLVSQIMPVSLAKQSTRGARGHAEVELLFMATLPHQGYKTFTVKPVSEGHSGAAVWTEPEEVPAEPSTFSISNSHGVKVTFSRSTGRVMSFGSGESEVAVDQQFLWYNGSDGHNNRSNQESGAYIFRPNHTADYPVNEQGNVAGVKVLRGPVVSEVHQLFNDWVFQTVRVLESNPSSVEMEYTVGPIPFADGLGKEIISRFSTDIKSDGVFYTDSNGRQLLERKRNHRPTWSLNLTQPIASNYYPVNTAIKIKDASKNFTVLADRAQGGSSMVDGSVELMVHRRLLHDDQRGVGEPLNETGVFGDGLIITGVHRVQSSAFQSSSHTAADDALDFFLEPILAFSEPLRNNSERSFLPKQVNQLNILTLQHEINVTQDTFLLRVEHYIPASDGGTPASLVLETLFPHTNITYEELTLSANLLKSDRQRMAWKVAGQEQSGYPKNADDGSTLVFHPMDIRTFRVKTKK